MVYPIIISPLDRRVVRSGHPRKRPRKEDGPEGCWAGDGTRDENPPGSAVAANGAFFK